MTPPPPATYDPWIKYPPVIHEHNSTKMWIKISTGLVLTIAAVSLLYWYIKGIRQRQRQRQHQQQEIHLTQMTAALPRRIFHSTGDIEADQPECSLCLEEYQDEEELVELPGCHHLYHSQCIEDALRRRREYCPFCRALVAGLG